MLSSLSELRSSTTPARDLPSPLLLPAFSPPPPPRLQDAVNPSPPPRRVPFPTSSAKDVSPSSQRFLLARFLRRSSDCPSHSPHAPRSGPRREEVDGVGAPLPPDGHRHTGILLASRRALAEARGRERVRERVRGTERQRERERGMGRGVSNTVTISSLSLLAVQPLRQLIHLCNCIDTLPLYRAREYIRSFLFFFLFFFFFFVCACSVRLDKTRALYK